MFKPDLRLKRIYDTYNRKFFDNALPHDTRVGWNDELEGYALTIGIDDEESKHRIFVVYINPNFHSGVEQYRLSLLHECIHIKLYPYMKHGRKFDEEILRLASRGALKGIL